ncbi:MAG: hypothetical protein KKH33_07070 [Alphaproteobacteria bacterium]|nr:hypothetical protein [Alphaproteobacteria bacterium]
MCKIAKLHIDLCGVAGLGASMDRDTADLIAQLRAKAGMAMEDASPIALSICAMPVEQWPATIDQLTQDVERIISPLHAARMIMRA